MRKENRKTVLWGFLILTFSAITFVPDKSVQASPPHGGGLGRGGSAAGWVNFGIGAARAVQQNRQGQHPNHQPHQQQQQYQQPQQYYNPEIQQQVAAPQVTIQPNAIPEKKVEPEKNAAPLADKVVPLRRREAKCYAHSLENNIAKAGETANSAWRGHQKAIGEQIQKSLAKLITDDAALKMITDLLAAGDLAKAREQVDGLKLSKEDQAALARNLDAAIKIDQQMKELTARLNAEATWNDVQKSLEQLAAAITELTQRTAVNPQAPPRMDGIVNGIGELANLLIIRDILLQAGNGDGPTRFTPIPFAQIPVGIIRVIYDPDLPVGTGLRINESAIITGTGGRGTLTTGIASAAEALGLPIAPGEPVADLGKDENPPKGGVLIGNPADNAGTIKYVLASAHPYDLKPGFKQHLPGSQTWLIEFDRGGSYGSARYTLAEGIYDFKVGDKGWDMVSRPLKAVIDNRDGVDDFHFVQDNKRETVKAGESRTIENKSPVVISFDRGGETATRKLLNKSGTYKVAVNIENNRYDLFAPVEPEKKSGDDAVAGGGD